MTDFALDHDQESRRERQSTQFCVVCENWARQVDELQHELNKRAFDASIAEIKSSENKQLRLEIHRLRNALEAVTESENPYDTAWQALEAK